MNVRTLSLGFRLNAQTKAAGVNLIGITDSLKSCLQKKKKERKGKKRQQHVNLLSSAEKYAIAVKLFVFC